MKGATVSDEPKRRTARVDLDGLWIHYNERGRKPRKRYEVRGVERQEVRYAMHMADSYQSGVMNLFANHPRRADQALPGREDGGRLR